jgi:hypothetical protein
MLFSDRFLCGEQATGNIAHSHSDTAECGQPASLDAIPDDRVLAEFTDWMANRLPCVAGRREYNLNRYMIRVASKATVPAILREYRTKLRSGAAVACVFVFNEPAQYRANSDAGDAFKFLARAMAQLGDKSAHELANGAPLTMSMQLDCPVTGQDAIFDDFECIAFCPQSDDREDPLYDPLMYAPYPCVNLSSDVYAFSNFVADRARNAFGKPLREVDEIVTIAAFLDRCVAQWQRIAEVTINNFEARTDTSLCPVHITPDRTHWVAAHKDPAFAEQKKISHRHELPVIYARRIVERWLDFFRYRGIYHASGLARDGLPITSCPHMARQ